MNNEVSNTNILVTGGTGVLGNSVCKILDEKRMSYVISTHNKANLQNDMVYCNLENGEGLLEVLNGKRYILHLASDKQKPDNDIIGIRRMLEVIEVLKEKPHLIYISIVGIDLLPLPYFKQKLLTEKIIQKSDSDYSILRATQFHEYILYQLQSFFRLPLIAFLPKQVLVQPVDVDVIAQKLVAMISERPSFGIEEIGGRVSMTLLGAAKAWLQTNKNSKLIIDFPLWGTWGKNLNAGALTTDKQTSSGKTWKEWLSNLNK